MPLSRATATFGLAWLIQLVPFQRTIRVSLFQGELKYDDPPATQVLLPVQSTSARPKELPSGPGADFSDQELPFHTAEREWSRYSPLSTTRKSPTPIQKLPLVQSIASNSSCNAPVGIGTACIAQAVPFRFSAIAVFTPPINAKPTAVQALVLMHETPRRAVSVAPTGFALVSIVQDAPFHTSIKETVPLDVLNFPTAVHDVVLGHVTSINSLLVEPAGTWGVDSVQLLPFQRSARTWLTPELVLFPTAIHILVLAGSQPIPYKKFPYFPDSVTFGVVCRVHTGVVKVASALDVVPLALVATSR